MTSFMQLSLATKAPAARIMQAMPRKFECGMDKENELSRNSAKIALQFHLNNIAPAHIWGDQFAQLDCCGDESPNRRDRGKN
ncbi:MAG: hypothetical protein HC855_13770 [Rhizobiales bacterium]|nr:hypothetical protein [Hyphomicrobiales bacterium]